MASPRQVLSSLAAKRDKCVGKSRTEATVRLGKACAKHLPRLLAERDDLAATLANAYLGFPGWRRQAQVLLGHPEAVADADGRNDDALRAMAECVEAYVREHPEYPHLGPREAARSIAEVMQAALDLAAEEGHRG